MPSKKNLSIVMYDLLKIPYFLILHRKLWKEVEKRILLVSYHDRKVMACFLKGEKISSKGVGKSKASR